jgi:hypothetical protein
MVLKEQAGQIAAADDFAKRLKCEERIKTNRMMKLVAII